MLISSGDFDGTSTIRLSDTDVADLSVDQFVFGGASLTLPPGDTDGFGLSFLNEFVSAANARSPSLEAGLSGLDLTGLNDLETEFFDAGQQFLGDGFAFA